MVFAMNGAEFGELGAASQSVAELQTALVALGKGIGDPTLMKVVVDGVMGPKTAAATNRALTVHLGAGQAPSNLRSGSLAQATISSMASQITALITTEIARRGFSAPGAAKVPAKKATVARSVAPTYAPTAASTALVPAAASPVYRVPTTPAASGGSDLDSIMKWAAIGIGVVVLGGAAYYFATRRKSGGGSGVRARTGVPGGYAGFGATTTRLNNRERELWVKNDEGLYRMWQREQHRKGGMRAFIKRNRAEIDAVIRGVVDREPGR
jgi:peptidoglycan hydrolase-like protein with peptidoglycan-binding domain